MVPLLVLTHVQSDSDDVERHGGVSDTAERHRLRDRQADTGGQTARKEREMKDRSATEETHTQKGRRQETMFDFIRELKRRLMY